MNMKSILKSANPYKEDQKNARYILARRSLKIRLASFNLNPTEKKVLI